LKASLACWRSVRSQARGGLAATAAFLHRAVALTEGRPLRAIAAEVDPEVDPDRRAWHRALATAGVDELRHEV